MYHYDLPSSVSNIYRAYSNGEMSYRDARKRLISNGVDPVEFFDVILRIHEEGRQERIQRVLKFGKE